MTSAEHDRLVTIIDEAFGLQPVMTTDELLTFLEKRLAADWRAREEALAKGRAEERARILMVLDEIKSTFIASKDPRDGAVAGGIILCTDAIRRGAP